MGWLSKFILSAGGFKIPEPENSGVEPSEIKTGIHLHYGKAYEYISNEIDYEVIERLIKRLDWGSGFYQIVCTLEPGVSMEVGGSLNELDGLSAVYRNRHKNIEAVIVNPPENQNEMLELLSSFVDGSDIWHTKYSW